MFVLPTSSRELRRCRGGGAGELGAGDHDAAAPWSSLAERGCGWWIEAGVEPLAAAIREAAELTDADRREMGSRGRRLVAERFAWPAIARRMLDVYRWLAGERDAPECVRRD